MDSIGNTLNKIPRENVTIKEQREYLMQTIGRTNHIKINYNPHDGITAFSVFKRNGPFEHHSKPYIGYIIDLAGGKRVIRENNEFPVMAKAPMPRVMCVVPVPIIDQYNFRDIAERDDARIVPITDGTTVTLYWHRNRWVYGTIGSYDFGNMPWSGDVTHSSIIENVFERCNFDVGKLDKGKCYTIGYKSDCHPFLEGGSEPICKMWLIRTVNIAGINAYINSPGDKVVEFESFESTTADVGIPLQEESTVNFSDILTVNNTAYDTFIQTGVVNYGYIVYLDGWAYLMDSDLYRNLRHIFYDAPVPGSRRCRRQGNRSNVTMFPIDRQKFCILHAMLSPIYSDMFLNLFPQFQPDVEHIKTELHVMHQSLVASYRRYTGAGRSRALSQSARSKNKKETYVATKYKKIWDVMIKRLPKTRSDCIIPSMISSFIVSENNAPLIYSIIYMNPTDQITLLERPPKQKQEQVEQEQEQNAPNEDLSEKQLKVSGAVI